MLSVYLIIGALAGVLSGLLGIGGGLIVVPALSAVFLHYPGVPKENVMHIAVSTSVATMIVTLCAGAYVHHVKKSINWQIVKKVLPGLVLGGVLGSVVTDFLSSKYLNLFFSVFLILVGMKMLFKSNAPLTTPARVFSNRTIQIAALLVGIFTSLLGAGGGALMMTFLLYLNLEIHEATGTSMACGIPVACVATVSFMVIALFFNVNTLPWSTGYIYWPAFLGVSLTSILFAPIGAMLAHKLPTKILKRVFAVFLLIIACDMIFI